MSILLSLVFCVGKQKKNPFYLVLCLSCFPCLCSLLILNNLQFPDCFFFFFFGQGCGRIGGRKASPSCFLTFPSSWMDICLPSTVAVGMLYHIGFVDRKAGHSLSQYSFLSVPIGTKILRNRLPLGKVCGGLALFELLAVDLIWGSVFRTCSSHTSVPGLTPAYQ